jgi:hypothetical protein
MQIGWNGRAPPGKLRRARCAEAKTNTNTRRARMRVIEMFTKKKYLGRAYAIDLRGEPMHPS